MTNQVNASFTVLRTGPVDDYTGAGTEKTVAEGVPGEFIEYNRRVWDPVTGAPRTVREVKVKVPFDVDVQAEDQLVDDGTGRVYPIREVHQPLLSGLPVEKVCEVVDLSNQSLS